MRNRRCRPVEFKLVAWLAVALSGASLGVVGLSLAGHAEAQIPSEGAAWADRRPPAPSELERLIQKQISEGREDLDGLQTRMDTLKERIDRLVEQLERIPPAQELPPEAEDAEEIRFRSPLFRLTDKNQIAFVCMEGKIAFIDTPAVSDRRRKILRAVEPQPGRTESVDFQVPGCDLQLRLKQPGPGSTGPAAGVFVVSNSGEIWDKARLDRSALRTKLESHDSDAFDCMFVVWPDSYWLFHQARELAWQEGFDVGLLLLSSGDPLPIGGGRSAVQ